MTALTTLESSSSGLAVPVPASCPVGEGIQGLDDVGTGRPMVSFEKSLRDFLIMGVIENISGVCSHVGLRTEPGYAASRARVQVAILRGS
ncbi:hypothetical protein AR689_11275 [Arthrobacter sp. EpRS71]|nr:hypothetical protein AR689_11275 [Arthrobacter sp. EpRS71]